MEIIKKCKKVEFGELNIGDVFESPIGVCMKIRDVYYGTSRVNTCTANAINLKFGEVSFIDLAAEVIPIKAELHVL